MGAFSGHATLNALRAYEKSKDLDGLDGIKVIMTTAHSDSKTIMSTFKSGCEAYIVKPINKSELLDEIYKLELLDAPV